MIFACVTHHANDLLSSVDEECLIELIEGCEALEKFKDVLDGRN